MRRNLRGWRIGESHHRAKLSDADVAKMRRVHAAGGAGYRILARAFRCSLSTVRDIVQYRTRPPT